MSQQQNVQSGRLNQTQTSEYTKHGKKRTILKIQEPGSWDSKQIPELMFSKREKAIAAKINKGKQSVAMQRHEEAFQNSLLFSLRMFQSIANKY